MVVELNENNFENEIAKGIVVVDFWAPWCGPCKKMGPVVDKIATENTSIVVAKVNLDESPNLANKYSVLSIPTIIIFKDGQFFDQVVGLCQEQKIIEKIDKAKQN